jgi:hypothetical protein
VPAPTVYKYLKYELPKGRNLGLGISAGGSNAPQAQAQQQQQQQPQQGGGGGTAGGWQMSAVGVDWGAPPTQPQAQQNPPGWQNATQSGGQNHQGGGNVGGWQNAQPRVQDSPAPGGGWCAVPNPAAAAGVGGALEAPAGASGW